MGLKEVTLLRPTKDARWGITPGSANGHVCVKALHRAGLARDQLDVGDRIVAIDGIAVASEPEVVERLNKAYQKASTKRGVTLTINRPVRSRTATSRCSSSRWPQNGDDEDAERRDLRRASARARSDDATEPQARSRTKSSDVEASGRSSLSSSRGSQGRSPLEVFEEEQRTMMAKVRREEVHAASLQLFSVRGSDPPAHVHRPACACL